MEKNVHEGILLDGPVNLPIQMMSLTDRDGRITPQWFRLETEDHEIRMYRVIQVISRDEKKYVGIREKQFICRIRMGDGKLWAFHAAVIPPGCGGESPAALLYKEPHRGSISG